MGSSQGQRQPIKRRSVFISSTSLDLVAHRQQVIDVLLRLGIFPVGMEHMGAQGSGDATKVSLDKVAEADVYVGLFAWRYGTILPGHTRSVTHLEYLEACRLGLPCYLFLADPKTEQSYAIFPASTRDSEHRAQVLELRRELQRSVVDYFTTPGDLAVRVATAMSNYLRDELLKGPRIPRDLPPRAPGFVGRTQELRTLSERLRRRQSVALAAALAGMGGVGKSALAAEMLYRLASDPGAFPGGITWVRAEGRKEVAGLAWVYEQLMTAWNITLTPEELGKARSFEAEADLREQAMRSRMRPQKGSEQRLPALVLLDNLEPGFLLNRALALFNSLEITVLITSRTEPASPGLYLMPLDVLDPASAVQLFAQRYREKGGNWNAARDERFAAEVVKALGHLPLAIELTAARGARMRLSVEALARELRGPPVLDKLKDPLDPTGSVRYSFYKSLALLNHTQQIRFAALGLPDGPDWPQPVVLRLLTGVPPGPPPPTLAPVDLDVLVGFSLVTLLPEEPSSAARDQATSLLPRVRLHPLLRELAREEWAKQPPGMQQVALHSLLFGVETLVREDAQRFAALTREEDLIAGTLHKVAQARLEPQKVSEVIDIFQDYLVIGGHWRVGVDLLVLQLSARRYLGQKQSAGATLINLGKLMTGLGRSDEAANYFKQALTVAREIRERRLEGAALNGLGGLNFSQGRTDEAAQYLKQALVVFQQVGERAGEAAAFNNLGRLAEEAGRVEEARQYYERARSIEQKLGYKEGEAVTLNNLGMRALELGTMEEAERYLKQALDIHRNTSNRPGEGATLHNLGLLTHRMGRKKEATHYYEQALAIAQEVGNLELEGASLSFLGRLADDAGQKEKAERCYEQALNVQRKAGDKSGEASTLTNLGMLADSLGKKEEAARHYAQALAIKRGIGDTLGEGDALNSFGTLEVAQGKTAEAKRHLEQARDMARKRGDKEGEAAALNNLGALAENQGKKEEARHYYEQALTIVRELREQAHEGIILNNLGNVARELGRLEEAEQYHKQALAIAREVKNRSSEARALNNLGTLSKVRGKLEEAVQYREQALAIAQEVRDREAEGAILGNLGALADDLRKYEEASRYYEQAIAIQQAIGDRRGEGTTLINLGNLAAKRGQKESAGRYYRQALAILDEIGAADVARVGRERLATLGS